MMIKFFINFFTTKVMIAYIERQFFHQWQLINFTNEYIINKNCTQARDRPRRECSLKFAFSYFKIQNKGISALRENRCYHYDVFGNNYTGSLAGSNALGYGGKRYDAATALYDYGFRDYDTSSGRFTTADPIRDGVNWYVYCNNAPVNFFDLGDWKQNGNKERVLQLKMLKTLKKWQKILLLQIQTRCCVFI